MCADCRSRSAAFLVLCLADVVENQPKNTKNLEDLQVPQIQYLELLQFDSAEIYIYTRIHSILFGHFLDRFTCMRTRGRRQQMRERNDMHGKAMDGTSATEIDPMIA